MITEHPKYPRYGCSQDGRVWSRMTTRYWKELKPFLAGKGYRVVTVCCGKQVKRYVHVLILETFVGPCPEGMECRHLDGNRANNCLSNLEWATHSTNEKDKRRHGTWSRHGRPVGKRKLTWLEVEEIRRLYASGRFFQRHLAEMFGVSRKNISWIALGKTWL